MPTVLVVRLRKRILIPVFQALDMIGNIRAAFNELLNELDWMDEPTKAKARDKVGGTCLLLCQSSGQPICLCVRLFVCIMCLFVWYITSFSTLILWYITADNSLTSVHAPPICTSLFRKQWTVSQVNMSIWGTTQPYLVHSQSSFITEKVCRVRWGSNFWPSDSGLHGLLIGAI